jgi:muramoyltetrapeptide carboxypeptidase LdcA involved in peptidoglycan recycling
MKQFTTLSKLKPGDQVAVISPSAGLPGLFPWVQDLGIKRLQDIFELIPKEYPTTRTMGAPLEDRAHDIMAAFRDTANKAVFTSIGGSDQIRLLKYLDTDVLRNNPKPFFGFSDNTHLHDFLWNLGVPSYYGGAIMTQLAFENGVPGMTVDFMKHALFDQGEFEVPVSLEYNDVGLDWSKESNLDKKRAFEPNDGLFWDGDKDTEGILWGGCVESLIAQVASEKFLPRSEDMEGVVLYIETAEDIPEHWIVEYLLTGFGERGWLDAFQAVLVGRPKAWEFDKPNSPEQKAAYRKEQRETILRTVRQYNKTIPVVQNLDFGHTNPQIIVPSGNKARVDANAQKVYLSY